MSMTTLDILCAQAERICEDTVTFVRDFAGMHPVNTYDDPIVILSPSGDQSWNALPSDGTPVQVALLRRIVRFNELVGVLVQDLPGVVQGDLAHDLDGMRSTVEQDGKTWWETIDDACEGVRQLASTVIGRLREYSGPPSSVTIAIPDTNVLLARPDIEAWRFDDTGPVTVILTPTVLSELDEHKLNHRNKDVREKSKTLIRKLKEYRRRGSLLEGVAVVKDRISLRAIAQEPDMTKTLSWFDPSNADDRFLATSLEVIRSNLAAQAFIVTLDINMQNKAEMAAIPFRELEEGAD